MSMVMRIVHAHRFFTDVSDVIHMYTEWRAYYSKLDSQLTHIAASASTEARRDNIHSRGKKTKKKDKSKAFLSRFGVMHEGTLNERGVW